MLSGIGEDTD